MKFKIIILMILAELFFTDLLLGDITWQLTDITKVSGKTIITRQSIYITENIFSIETEDGMRMILNISANTLTIIDNNQKTFSTTSINEMEEKAANLELENEKMIEEALQNIPEEQRGLYKEMLKQQLATADSSEKTAPDWEKLKSTGKTVTIAGYNAIQYVTEEEDGTRYEVWCGTEVNMTEVKDFFENIRKISFFKDIMQNFSALNLGFPLKSVYKKDDSEYASEVTSIHFEKIPLSFFEVPEGYTTTESEISK